MFFPSLVGIPLGLASTMEFADKPAWIRQVRAETFYEFTVLAVRPILRLFRRFQQIPMDPLQWHVYKQGAVVHQPMTFQSERIA